MVTWPNGPPAAYTGPVPGLSPIYLIDAREEAKELLEEFGHILELVGIVPDRPPTRLPFARQPDTER